MNVTQIIANDGNELTRERNPSLRQSPSISPELTLGATLGNFNTSIPRPTLTEEIATSLIQATGQGLQDAIQLWTQPDGVNFAELAIEAQAVLENSSLLGAPATETASTLTTQQQIVAETAQIRRGLRQEPQGVTDVAVSDRINELALAA